MTAAALEIPFVHFDRGSGSSRQHHGSNVVCEARGRSRAAASGGLALTASSVRLFIHSETRLRLQVGPTLNIRWLFELLNFEYGFQANSLKVFNF